MNSRVVAKLEDRQGQFALQTQTITIPKDLVVTIGTGKDKKGIILSSGYDIISRNMGICFDQPEVLENTPDGRATVRLRCVYYNEAGQKVTDAEEYTIDARELYQYSRVNWQEITYKDTGEKWPDGNSKKTKVVGRKANLEITAFDEHGTPCAWKVTGIPPEAEQELYQGYLHLKGNALRKAITCARRRLIQRAAAVKSANPSGDVKLALWRWVPTGSPVTEANDIYGPGAVAEDRAEQMEPGDADLRHDFDAGPPPFDEGDEPPPDEAPWEEPDLSPVLEIPAGGDLPDIAPHVRAIIGDTFAHKDAIKAAGGFGFKKEGQYGKGWYR